MRNDLSGRLGRKQHEISVGGLIDHELRADDATAARLVLDDDRALQRPRHVIRNQPSIGISRTASGERDDQTRRATARELRESGAGGSSSREGEESAAVHGGPTELDQTGKARMPQTFPPDGAWSFQCRTRSPKRLAATDSFDSVSPDEAISCTEARMRPTTVLRSDTQASTARAP